MTAWWHDLVATVWRLFDERGLLVAFVLLLLEESGMPPLIPGDLLMVLAGIRAAEGRSSLIEVLVLLEVATVVGGSVLYWLSAWGGHVVVARVGRHVGATPERIARASDLLQRHGERAIFVGRLLPSLCVLTAVAAGLLGFPFRRFLPALALGGFVHLLAFVMLGYWFGPPIIRELSRLHPPFELIASLVVLATLAFWIVRLSRRTPATPVVRLALDKRVRGGMLASVFGAIASTVLADIWLYGGGLIVQPPITDSRIATDLIPHGPLLAFASVMAMAWLVACLIWGAVYGAVEPSLWGRAWVRGALFSLAPLALWVLAVIPIAGGGWSGQPRDVTALLLAGEVVRSLAYGLTLGTAYSVLSPHRTRRVAEV